MSNLPNPIATGKPQPPLYQWECSCRKPPVRLGIYDLTGRITIGPHERYWRIDGRVATNCQKCGKQHLLQLQVDPELIASLPLPWSAHR